MLLVFGLVTFKYEEEKKSLYSDSRGLKGSLQSR